MNTPAITYTPSNRQRTDVWMYNARKGKSCLIGHTMRMIDGVKYFGEGRDWSRQYDEHIRSFMVERNITVVCF